MRPFLLDWHNVPGGLGFRNVINGETVHTDLCRHCSDGERISGRIELDSHVLAIYSNGHACLCSNGFNKGLSITGTIALKHDLGHILSESNSQTTALIETCRVGIITNIAGATCLIVGNSNVVFRPELLRSAVSGTLIRAIESNRCRLKNRSGRRFYGDGKYLLNRLTTGNSQGSRQDDGRLLAQSQVNTEDLGDENGADTLINGGAVHIDAKK